MNKLKRVDLIREAQALVAEAQELVEGALEGMDEEAHFIAYGRYGFDQLLNNGNPYDQGLEDLERAIEQS